jgi:restriction system protein
MKLRMAENSLFAILLRQRWWVSASVALALGLVGMALLPADWRVAGALSGFPFAVIAVMAAWRGRHTPSADRVAQVEAAVRAMPWPAFAALLEQAFQRDGHRVQRISPSNSSSGADFELLRQGQTLLVSARRWKSAHTGIEPLRELQAARDKAGAAALCIGLGQLSEPAAAFAAQHRIAIWGAAELAEALRGLPLPPPRP